MSSFIGFFGFVLLTLLPCVVAALCGRDSSKTREAKPKPAVPEQIVPELPRRIARRGKTGVPAEPVKATLPSPVVVSAQPVALPPAIATTKVADIVFDNAAEPPADPLQGLNPAQWMRAMRSEIEALRADASKAKTEAEFYRASAQAAAAKAEAAAVRAMAAESAAMETIREMWRAA